MLVTGGTGFVGTHIVDELLKQGARVRVPVHSRPLIIRDDRIESVPADLRRPADCLALTDSVDYVFHAAGVVGGIGVGAAGVMSAISTNLVLTAQMFQAAWTSGVERVLIFSSSMAYPPADYPIKEEEMWVGEPHPAYQGYGWMRRYFERLGAFVASQSKVKVAIVRPTAIYGRHDNFDPAASHVIPALIRKAVDRVDPYVVWGTGNEVRDFLHVSDLARGCLLMLEKAADGAPVNIGYGRATTVREIVQAVLTAADYSDASVVFDSTKPASNPFRMVDTGKARRLLGFAPSVSLEDGLRDTVRWYRSAVAAAP